jgi:hypothetical protein
MCDEVSANELSANNSTRLLCINRVRVHKVCHGVQFAVRCARVCGCFIFLKAAASDYCNYHTDHYGIGFTITNYVIYSK